MAGEEPLLLGETCERSARYARYARDRRDLGETCEISARLHPPSTCERQGQRAQGWEWRCGAVRDAVRCGAERCVGSGSKNHSMCLVTVNRRDSHCIHLVIARGGGPGRGGVGRTLTLTRRQWISSGLQRYRLRGSAQQRRFRHGSGTASVSWLIHLAQLLRLHPDPNPNPNPNP